MANVNELSILLTSKPKLEEAVVTGSFKGYEYDGIDVVGWD